MSAPVPLPATLVGLGTHRPFLAIADRLEPVGGNALLREEVAGGCRAAIAETEVVFGRPALVAVAFYVNRGIREIGEYPLEGLRVRRQRGARVIPNVVRIVVEERI